ncbi:MAG: Ig-like domain-containing protein [Actinomycetota bacterium]|nr:Ig-like domain-containing protein [Actinomycetota bacterium]
MANGDNGGFRIRNLWRCARVTAAVLLASTAASVVGAPPASADSSIAITPDFPLSGTVGQTNVPASVLIQNFSTHPHNVDDVIIDSITLVPSCAVFDPGCSGNADPAAVTLSATGTGTSGTSCAGKTFNIVVNNPNTGQAAFNPVGEAVALAPPNPSNALDTCRIDFTFSVRKVPSHDSQATSGIQTNQVARVTAHHGDGTQASATGPEIMTVNAAQPMIVTRATPSKPLGNPISDFATVTGVSNGPVITGTVTFTLYGPNDASCSGAPAFTSTEPVANIVPSEPPQAIAFTQPFTPTALGTYRWVATYSGDANYSAATSACNSPREISVITAAASIGVFRPSGGFWFFHDGPTVQWGTSGDIAVPADYNGDGSQDIAVFRPSSGVWFVRNGETVAFGTNGDIPVPGDYDGDGDDDMAVFRPSSGVWFVRNGETVAFGTNGDIPVPGDYNGDSREDMAVFRPSLGVWLVRNGPSTAFGASGDIPVPGDYDGDGDDDVAVFRPPTGVWFIANGTAVAFGTSGDDPLPLPAAVRERFFP